MALKNAHAEFAKLSAECAERPMRSLQPVSRYRCGTRVRRRSPLRGGKMPEKRVPMLTQGRVLANVRRFREYPERAVLKRQLGRGSTRPAQILDTRDVTAGSFGREREGRKAMRPFLSRLRHPPSRRYSSGVPWGRAMRAGAAETELGSWAELGE